MRDLKDIVKKRAALWTGDVPVNGALVGIGAGLS